MKSIDTLRVSHQRMGLRIYNEIRAKFEDPSVYDVLEYMDQNYLPTAPRYILTDESFKTLQNSGVPEKYLLQLEKLRNKYTLVKKTFLAHVAKRIGKFAANKYEKIITHCAIEPSGFDINKFNKQMSDYFLFTEIAWGLLFPESSTRKDYHLDWDAIKNGVFHCDKSINGRVISNFTVCGFKGTPFQIATHFRLSKKLFRNLSTKQSIEKVVLQYV